MIKKLLYTILFLFCFWTYGQTIQMTTTSNTDRWSPFNVVKSGGNLSWTATNPLIGTITINQNQPIFNFSANNGSDILITVTSEDSFNGLSIFDLRDRFNGVSINGIPSQMLVKEIDLSVAVNLVDLSTQYNRLPGLDISKNIKLQKLNIRGSRQMANGIDLSNNPFLTQIIADVTALTAIDFSTNKLLKDVRLYDARLTSVILDKVLIDLDNHGLSNGKLQIAGQANGQSITSASFAAYNNLKAKGWTIDVAAPLADTEVPVVGILSNPTNITQNSMTLSWSAGTDNVAVTNYKIYKNGILETQVGNVLAYAVTGLALNTAYDFHITALDAAGLESGNSNSVQGTTLQAVDTEVPVVGILSNPTNITQNAMTLSWSAGTDNVAVTNYKIYKNGVFEAQVGNVLTYPVTGLAPNTAYDFHITALDAAGLESGNSNSVQGTTLQAVDTEVPVVGILSNPTNITQNSMTLSWSAGTDNVAVTNYKIYRNGVYEAQVGNVLTYPVTGLAPNTAYNFHITALDAAGLESGNSNTVQGTTIQAIDTEVPVVGILSNPTNITQNAMTLSWFAGTDNVAVTNYKIYRNGVYEAQVGNVLTYPVTGLAPNTTYNFHITALDAAGLESGNSNSVQGTTIQAPLGDSITITTSSLNAAWSPQTVTKTGGILTWTATGSGLAGSPIVINANDPTFNFSSNNGSPITIKVTSPDGFNGLTVLDLWVAPSGGLISSVDLTNAPALTLLNTRYNPLTGLNVIYNTALNTLILRGNRQLSNQALNTANNTKLTYLQIDGTGINSVDISNNKLLKDVRLYDARLTSVILDKVLIDLDNHGLSNGNLRIAGQTTGQSITSASFAAYNNLKAKGWTIDVAAPLADTEVPVVGILSNPTNIAQNSMTLSWSAGTDNVAVTNYKIYKNGILETQVGNVLAYEVTGLALNTAYDFHITALDAAGLESGNSNSVQGTTLQAVDTEVPVVGILSNPTNITQNAMTLSWSAGTDNVAVTNYKIYKNGVFEAQVGNVLTYPVTGLAPNTAYDFHITALDAAGLESGNSNSVQGTTIQAIDTEVPVVGILNNPTNITQNAMTLSWSAGTDNVAVTNYKIYRNGVYEAQVGNVLTYPVTGLAPNTAYDFHITALDAAGLESGNSNSVQGTTLQAVDTEVPVVGILSNPTNITQNSMTLSWSAGTDNVAVTNYKIYRNGVYEAQVGNVLTYPVTGLAPNTAYNFHITALDAAGLESGNSNTVQGTTIQAIDTEVPVVGILSNPTNITQNAMTLSWFAGTDNVAVTNYKIYRNGVYEAQVGNVLTYPVTGLAPNTTYNFHITALDAAGLESGNSNSVQGTTIQAPLGDSITITTSSLNAAWSPQTVTKTGGILTWTATGSGLAGSPIVINANDPTFNFSSNNGSPITIKVTSPDGFNGLTVLDLWVAPSGGLISSVDLTNAPALTLLNTRYNPLTGLNVIYNTALNTLILRGNRQLSNQALNTANNTKLTYLQIDGTGINSVDISNNKLLKDVRLYDARLTSVILDKVLIDLDNHGLSNGNLRIAGQTTGQSITSASFAAYNNLKAKGWTIDVAAPPSPIFFKDEMNGNDQKESLKESVLSVYRSDEGFNISSIKVIKEVKVYDILGRIIFSSKPNQLSFYMDVNNLRNGSVLIVQVELENGIVLRKKVIKA